MSFFSILVFIIMLFLFLREWNNDKIKTIDFWPLAIFALPTVLSILHLKGDLEEAKTGVEQTSYTWYIIACYILLIVIVNKSYTNRQVALREKEQEEIRKLGKVNSLHAYYIDGLNMPANTRHRLLLFNDSLQIQAPSNNFKLDINQISGAYIQSEKELIEKEKSVVGRAIVGGVALGPIGAVVGGLSGLGTKKDYVLKHFLIITYENSNGERKALVYLPEQTSNNPNESLVLSMSFASSIKALLPHTNSEKVIQL